MSKRIFTKEQIDVLSQNQNIARCSEKSISYDKGFKMMAVKEYQKGLSPTEIFKEADFNIDLIGKKTPERCLHRWLRTVRQKGESELKIECRGRGKGGGRPKVKWLDEKEKIKYLEAQIAYLEEENHFLAKLRKKSLN